MQQEAQQPFRLFLLDRVHAVHLEAEVVGNSLLCKEDNSCDQDRDNGDRRGKPMIHTAFTDILLVNFHREGAVPFTDQHRRTEVCHRPQENHQRNSQDRGHAQRDDDLHEAPDPGAVQVFGCFQQGLVDPLQRTADIQIDQREKLGRHHQHDAAEPVNAGHGHMEGVLHELCDGAAPSQQQDPGIGPDKGSGHGAEDGDDLEEEAALQFINGVGISQQDQGRKVVGFPEELLEIRQ